MEPRTDLGLEIKSIRLVDTHEHLWPEDHWAGDNAKLIERMKERGEPGWDNNRPDILQDLFLNYVRSDPGPFGHTSDRGGGRYDAAGGASESATGERCWCPSPARKSRNSE